MTKQHSQKREEIIITAGCVSRAGLDDFYDFEEVENEGQVGFAVFDGETAEFKTKYQHLENCPCYLPKPKEQIPWLLPSMPVEYGSEQDLFRQVRNFIFDHVDLQFGYLYDVLTAWTLAQWRSEEWDSVPYLYFVGPKNSGKTRVCEVLQNLSYRGISTASMSTATVYHAIDKDSITPFFDEADNLVDSKEKRELLSIINNGYRRGGKVFRYNVDKNDYEYFNVYGFKAFNSIRLLAETLESRSIPVYMQRKVRRVNMRVQKEKATLLRGKLLLYRFRHLALDTSDASDASDTLLGALSEDSRLIELFSPLVTVTEGMKVEQNAILEAFKKYAATREIEETLTIEAGIIEAVNKARSTMENSKLPIANIAHSFNATREEREQWRSDSIGRQLKKLGFESCRMPDSKRGIVWNESLFLKLQHRFSGVYALQNASEASVVSVASGIETEQHTSLFPQKPSFNSLCEECIKRHSARLEDLKALHWNNNFLGVHCCAVCHGFRETGWQ